MCGGGGGEGRGGLTSIHKRKVSEKSLKKGAISDLGFHFAFAFFFPPPFFFFFLSFFLCVVFVSPLFVCGFLVFFGVSFVPDMSGQKHDH